MSPFPDFFDLLASWGLPVSAPMRTALGFAFRTCLSALLAFWICCKLEIESPQWALMAVLIVARPQTGMLLSRAVYRMMGTVVGCLLGMLLIILFAQTPELFIGAFALLIGLCTVWANLLTNFRSYAAVLAGYTAAVVGLGAIDNPATVFDVAMARGSSNLIGIACTVVISALLAPQHSREQVLAGLKSAIAEAARRACFSWHGDDLERKRMGRHLIEHLIGLNTLVEFASAESGAFRVHRATADSLLVHLFGVISAKRGLDAHVLRCGMPAHPPLLEARDACFAFLQTLPAHLDEEEPTALLYEIADLRTRLGILDPENLPLSPQELVSHRIVIDRLDELLRELGDALKEWARLHRRRIDRPPVRINFHRDHRAAWINGLRATLATAAIGAFWIASAWTHGPGALVIISVLLSLFSTVPHPDRVGWAFFQAGCVALVAAYFCKFGLLTHTADYGSFSLVIGLFLFPCCVMLCYPKTAGFAAAFPIVFVTVVAPANPMQFNALDFLNLGIATLVGVLTATLAYRLVLPPDPQAARRYVVRRILDSLENISQEHCISFEDWTTRMYDRIIRLSDPENLSGTPTDEWLDTGLGSVDLGCELFRLRTLAADERLPREVRQALENAQAHFVNLRAHPRQALAAARNALSTALGWQPDHRGGTEIRRTWARTAGVLEEINARLSGPHSILNHPIPA